MHEIICYCFGYTSEDIRHDLLRNGRSTILDRIKKAKKDGGCNCANRNPKRRRCIPEVHRVVNEITGYHEGIPLRAS